VERIDGFKLESGDYEYVIITDQELFNARGEYNFQDLRDHKMARGVSTTIVTTEWIYPRYSGTRPDGEEDNPTRIRNFIIDAYQTWGTKYVLLGGDGDAGGESGDNIIPARYFTDNGLYGVPQIAADMYYACLDGTFDYNANGVYGELGDGPEGGEVDLFAEVYVGRAPADSAEEVSNFVRKTIVYENSDPEDLKEALILGENLGWNVTGCDFQDEIENGTCNHDYCTVGFPEDYDITKLCDDRGDPAWGKNDLIPLLNKGSHLISHLGHANVNTVMHLVNSDVDALTNDKYFLAYSQGCYCGSFDNQPVGGGGGGCFITNLNLGPSSSASAATTDYDSIAEHFVTQPSGAFAVIMNSRYGWGNRDNTNGPSQHFNREFIDAYFGEELVNLRGGHYYTPSIMYFT